MNITQATINDLDILAGLFDDYRQFYQQTSDIAGAKAFLAHRIENGESIVFLARNDKGEVLGFTQLYPSFCSVLMKPIFVLYDLFVTERARRMGAANQLMAYAENFAKEKGAAELQLSTAKDNYSAQTLYEQRNWKRDKIFYHYSKTL